MSKFWTHLCCPEEYRIYMTIYNILSLFISRIRVAVNFFVCEGGNSTFFSCCDNVRSSSKVHIRWNMCFVIGVRSWFVNSRGARVATAACGMMPPWAQMHLVFNNITQRCRSSLSQQSRFNCTGVPVGEGRVSISLAIRRIARAHLRTSEAPFRTLSRMQLIERRVREREREREQRVSWGFQSWDSLRGPPAEVGRTQDNTRTDPATGLHAQSQEAQ